MDAADAPVCRICYEGSDEGVLLTPCACTGSIGSIHAHCLSQVARDPAGAHKSRLRRLQEPLELCENADAARVYERPRLAIYNGAAVAVYCQYAFRR